MSCHFYFEYLILGIIHEDRLRELLTTMGDRFTDEEVRLFVMRFFVIRHHLMTNPTGSQGQIQNLQKM